MQWYLMRSFHISIRLCKGKEVVFMMCTSWCTRLGVWKGVWGMQREHRESKQKISKLKKIIGHPSSMHLCSCSFQREMKCSVLLWGMLLLSRVGLQISLQLLTNRQTRGVLYEENQLNTVYSICSESATTLFGHDRFVPSSSSLEGSLLSPSQPQ